MKYENKLEECKMDYKEAIHAIKANFPDDRYTVLQEALTLAIRTMNDANSPLEPEMACVIINGEPTQETYTHYRDRGWIIMYISQAKRFHPYACETDTILFMSKPIDKEKYDAYMREHSGNDQTPESAGK
jgi:hypothetical protein